MAHDYRATVRWRRNGAVFVDNRYSRAHVWAFDGGVEVPASSSPSVVRLPLSRADAVDPEEAFVAALASCHMLFFLSFAAHGGIVVDAYEDEAVGVMRKNADGKLYVAKVTLKPRVAVSGAKRPTEAEIADLHHKSHDECFIANSVKSEIAIEALPLAFA
ncbi:MAG: OsmC family protein [Hyphomicrobiaceae bacterium]